MGTKRLRKRADKIARQDNVMKRLLEGDAAETIAEIVGISVSTVQRDVNDALDRLSEDIERNAHRYRARQQVELNLARSALMPLVVKGVRGAMETLIKLHRREAQLLNLDIGKNSEPPREDPPFELVLRMPDGMSASDYPKVQPDEIVLPKQLPPAQKDAAKGAPKTKVTAKTAPAKKATSD